jgi:Flp pilus assembly pilin Flp
MTRTDLNPRFTRRCSNEAGQTLLEYAPIALLVSIAAIVLLSALGIDLAEWFDAVENTLGVGGGDPVDTTRPGDDDVAALSGGAG